MPPAACLMLLLLLLRHCHAIIFDYYADVFISLLRHYFTPFSPLLIIAIDIIFTLSFDIAITLIVYAIDAAIIITPLLSLSLTDYFHAITPPCH
jgi:hypothetical protein